MESLLGLRLEGERLVVGPCLPAAWDGFTVHYRYRETVYHVAVRQTATAVTTATLDGVTPFGSAIPLVDDRRDHGVEVEVPRRPDGSV